MPNHVDNRLTITGPKADRDAFAATFDRPGHSADHQKGTFCFGQTAPMPADVYRENLSREDQIKYPGDKNWYDWSINHWGTKWGNYDTAPVEITPKSIKLRFNTAWAPPTAWMMNVSKQFPNLKFSNKWKDEMGPRGSETFQNGETIA